MKKSIVLAMASLLTLGVNAETRRGCDLQNFKSGKNDCHRC